MKLEELKQIHLVAFLASLNHRPVKVTESEYLYKSPYREENNPSFFVNIKKNVWMDFGTGEGGGIVQLASKIFQEENIFNLLQKIEQKVPIAETFYNDFSAEQKLKSNAPEIAKIQEIVHPALRDYFRKRGISLGIAQQFCEEVHYKIGDHNFYSIGFKNNSGGWELRNPLVKNGIAPKDITLMRNNASQLTVFEGFFDFLSLKQLELSPKLNLGSETLEKLLREKSDYLILNSTAFLKKLLPIISHYNKGNLFLDNDATGISAASAIESVLKKSVNFSVLYSDQKDLNEWLVHRLDKEKAHTLQIHPRENLEKTIAKEQLQQKRGDGLSR